VKVLHVAGARPNFMKVAPVLGALKARGVDNVLVHTGQHYDVGLSGSFFDDLGLPEPDHHLEVGSGSHAEQTARVLERIEPVLLNEQPDLVVVVGDVNSTIAAALASVKLLLPVAHVEAGLRSFDRTMPEEVNRVLTDQISDLLFTTSPEAEDNLAREGIDRARIHFVGNPMIDSLEQHLDRARASLIRGTLGLDGERYAVVTLHRPSNVDDADTLRGILGALAELAGDLPVIFPVHPRTLKMMRARGLEEFVQEGVAKSGLVSAIEPLGYIDFLRMMMDAAVVLTDSGGIQEETTILGVPCVTLRHNTERPITLTDGSNVLVGTDPDKIVKAARDALGSSRPPVRRPPLWDGKAGERIADVILGWHAARA